MAEDSSTSGLTELDLADPERRALAEQARDGEAFAAEVLRDLCIQRGELFPGQFPWQPMSTAPRDGSEFIVMLVTTVVGGKPRRCDLEFDMFPLRRSRSTPESDGCWMSGSDERGSSVSDHAASRGFWMRRAELDATIAKLAPFYDAPLDRVVVFVRQESERHAAKGAWMGEDGWRWCGGEMHSSYLNSYRYLHHRYLHDEKFRWCELVAFLPYIG